MYKSPGFWRDCRFITFKHLTRTKKSYRRLSFCSYITRQTLTHVDMTGLSDWHLIQGCLDICLASAPTLLDLTFDDRQLLYKDGAPRSHVFLAGMARDLL